MGKQILLIDDNRLIHIAVAVALEGEADLELAGQAYLGKDAEDLCQRTCFDLIILDLNLPDADGIDVLRVIRKTHSFIPVVILSSEDRSERIQQVLAAGATSFIGKFVSKQEFVQALRQVVSLVIAMALISSVFPL